MFFDEFVDKCHHAKEEQSLFPLIEIKGIPKEGGSYRSYATRT
jgi:hemerythrin-like domain-containing protein